VRLIRKDFVCVLGNPGKNPKEADLFELPEYTTLARQMNRALRGKIIQQGILGNSPHKFVWYNRTRKEFEELTRGKRVGMGRVKGRWLSLDLEPGYRLLLGECGGKVLYHEPGVSLPVKYHLSLTFNDGSALTIMTAMWGAIELYVSGLELERKYIKGMRPTPVDPEFSFEYFTSLIEDLRQEKKRSIKSLLTQDQLIPGLGNAIAQDIMFNARLNPRHSIVDLSSAQCKDLHTAIIDTTEAVIGEGGRNDESDLFGHPGGYVRMMDSHSAGNPCSRCGQSIEKMQYLGGACYFCPECQL
jgi:formamidopyrimidine-DNA glycosylase